MMVFYTRAIRRNAMTIFLRFGPTLGYRCRAPIVIWRRSSCIPLIKSHQHKSRVFRREHVGPARVVPQTIIPVGLPCVSPRAKAKLWSMLDFNLRKLLSNALLVARNFVTRGIKFPQELRVAQLITFQGRNEALASPVLARVLVLVPGYPAD